jgi:hypothetical protein
LKSGIRHIGFALLLVLIAISLHAQQESEFGYVDSAFAQKVAKFEGRKIILKTNPAAILSGDIPLLTGEFRILGEWVTGPKTSVVAGVSYLGMGLLYRNFIDNDTTSTASGISSWDYGVNGFRVQAGFKYYLKNPRIPITSPDFNPAPQGIYLQPLFSYSTAKYYIKARPDDYYQFTHWSVTANVGIQFLVGERITMDPFFGLGYKQHKIDNFGSTAPISQTDLDGSFIYDTNLKINLGFNLGVRF